MAIRLGQQIHQRVNILARHIDDWEQNRRAGDVGQEPIGIKIVRKLARKLGAPIENFDLAFAGASDQRVWCDRFNGINRVEPFKEIGAGIIEQKERSGLAIVRATGGAALKIQIGSAKNFLPSWAFEWTIRQRETS